VIDDKERAMEMPSMNVTRIGRFVGHGHGIAPVEKENDGYALTWITNTFQLREPKIQY
jgi:hypothetical protein